ncbi:MAG: DUF420 domain-containing protein [Saprospiraceae bacterium]|nr:DUF420 domain-containing protein [Saprospiraceae bacterium]
MNVEEARLKEQKLNRWAWMVSVLVFLLVLMMRRIKIESSWDFGFLPPFYSLLNLLTFFVLVAALYYIKVRKDIDLHRKMMTAAVCLSAAFLLLYVLYHFTTTETVFCKVGSIRYVYFTILISHIVLAAVILPFILLTYIRAYTGQFIRHVKLARWVWPLWAYVVLSGPIVYLMLRPCYQ